jgi:hypothetical protein
LKYKENITGVDLAQLGISRVFATGKRISVPANLTVRISGDKVAWAIIPGLKTLAPQRHILTVRSASV